MSATSTSARNGGDAAPFGDVFTGPAGRSLLPGGYGRGTFAIAPRTPMAVSGSGCRVRDDSGRELIDLHNNFTAMLHGYGHPQIVEAACEAMRNGSSFGLPTMYEVDHAAHMLDRLRYVDQIRYANSGTEAVMLAVRLARAVTGRDKVVMVHMAYHGQSDVALTTGGAPARRGIPDGVLRDTIEIAVNDEQALAEVFAAHPGRIAAVIVDPMPNRAGLIKVTPEFYRAARTQCDDHGTVLISDEVIALRLGYEGAAVRSGVTPDLVTMGKIIGGGTPVGAVAGTFELMNALNPLEGGLEHAGTFTGNPVTMAAGLVSMQLYTRQEVERLNALGARLRARLEASVQALGWEVRGDGSLVRLYPKEGSAVAVKAAQNALWWESYDRGVLLGQNVSGALSTPMDQTVVDDVAERLVDAVAGTGVPESR